MDPYVVIKNRQQVLRTKEHTDGGKTPQWNETLTLDVKYVGDDITMDVVDSEAVGSDERIGTATIKLSSMCVVGGLDEWWSVAYKGKKAGQLHLRCMWQPAGGVAGAVP